MMVSVFDNLSSHHLPGKEKESYTTTTNPIQKSRWPESSDMPSSLSSSSGRITWSQQFRLTWDPVSKRNRNGKVWAWGKGWGKEWKTSEKQPRAITDLWLALFSPSLSHFVGKTSRVPITHCITSIPDKIAHRVRTEYNHCVYTISLDISWWWGKTLLGICSMSGLSNVF